MQGEKFSRIQSPMSRLHFQNSRGRGFLYSFIVFIGPQCDSRFIGTKKKEKQKNEINSIG